MFRVQGTTGASSGLSISMQPALGQGILRASWDLASKAISILLGARSNYEL